jgi:hypothetical protein
MRKTKQITRRTNAVSLETTTYRTSINASGLSNYIPILYFRLSRIFEKRRPFKRIFRDKSLFQTWNPNKAGQTSRSTARWKNFRISLQMTCRLGSCILYIVECVFCTPSALLLWIDSLLLSCVEGKECQPVPNSEDTQIKMDCGSNIAFPYFVSFIFFCSFLVSFFYFCNIFRPQPCQKLNVSSLTCRCWIYSSPSLWTISTTWLATPRFSELTISTNLSEFGPNTTQTQRTRVFLPYILYLNISMLCSNLKIVL